MNILVPKKHLGKSVPQICSLKKLSSSVASGKPNSDYSIFIHFNLLHCELVKYCSEIVLNEHFSAQETPGEKLPTDLQLEKAKLLCCFRQAKQ